MDLTLYSLLKRFLERMAYHVDSRELKLQLLSHPSYPSLHSVTGLLSHFGIENLALEVPKNKETLSELPEFFLSITNDQQYVLVKKLKKGVSLWFDDKQKEQLSTEEFLDSWSGIIVAVDKNQQQNENTQKYAETNIFYWVSGMLLIGLFFYTEPALFNSLHFLFSLAGLTLSVFIVKHESGFTSKTLDKFCSSHESTSCDVVLDSKAASITKHIKLSDACITYFGALSLYWMVSQFGSAPQQVVVIPTLLAMPITFFSIYYQALVVKKWCPLCLGITLVLWFQFLSLIVSNGVASLSFNVLDGLVFLASVLLVFGIWSITKPLLAQSADLNSLRIAHHKFIRNFDLFRAALGNTKFVSTQMKELEGNEIVLGNEKALLRLVLVTNPQCRYCKEAHQDIEKVLDRHSQNVSVTIRFSVDTKTENAALKVSQRLLELYESPKTELFGNALHEAYSENADLENWIKKWGGTSSISGLEVLNRQRDWCTKNNINFTPALFINDREFPEEYEREHLSYFIEDLTELYTVSEEEPTKKPAEVVNT